MTTYASAVVESPMKPLPESKKNGRTIATPMKKAAMTFCSLKRPTRRSPPVKLRGARAVVVLIRPPSSARRAGPGAGTRG